MACRSREAAEEGDVSRAGLSPQEIELKRQILEIWDKPYPVEPESYPVRLSSRTPTPLLGVGFDSISVREKRWPSLPLLGYDLPKRPRRVSLPNRPSQLSRFVLAQLEGSPLLTLIATHQIQEPLIVVGRFRYAA